MPLPAPLSRVDPRSSKKDFGHRAYYCRFSVDAGASALSSLAAMRSGAGMVTAAVPVDLEFNPSEENFQCVMTKPLAQRKTGAYSLKAYGQ